MTANGEVQTREEATAYVKELDLFVTVMLLKETPAVLSLGKLCEDHGYTYHWTSGQKPQLTKKGKRIDCNISNFAIRSPWFIDEFLHVMWNGEQKSYGGLVRVGQRSVGVQAYPDGPQFCLSLHEV